jgi:hypothetical protein
MSVAAPGVLARFEATNGKPQAGVVFQGSWTVGLLLTLTP